MQRGARWNFTELSCEKWDNLIEAAVSGKSRLQVKLIHKLHDLVNVPEACKYAVKYYISPDKLPANVKGHLKDYVKIYKRDVEKNSPVQIDEVESETEHPPEDWEEEVSSDSPVTFSITTGFVTQEEATTLDDYYKLDLHSDKIILVDTIKGWKSLSKNLFTNAKVIGFDVEWKPVLCRAGEQDRVSIFQLAITGKVFILDLHKL